MDGNTDGKEVSNRKAANRLKKFINSINHIGKKAGGEEGQLHIRKNVLLQPKTDKKHLHLQPRGDWHKLRCALYGGSKEQSLPNTQASWHTCAAQSAEFRLFQCIHTGRCVWTTT